MDIPTHIQQHDRLGMGSRVFAKVNFTSSGMTIQNDNSSWGYHVPIQFNNVLADANSLWVSTLSAPTSLDAYYGIAAGGAGYSVNDVLTVSGGSPTTAAQYRVVSVSGGAVTGVTLQTAGSYPAKGTPVSPAATTVAPAGGAGCTLNINWQGAHMLVPAGFTYAETIINASWAANATGRRQIATRLQAVGTELASALDTGGQNIVPNNSATIVTAHQAVSGLFAVSAGQKIQFCCVQNSGGSLALNPTGGSFAQVKLYRSLNDV